MRLRCEYLIVTLFVLTISIDAQTNISILSGEVGFVRNYQYDFSNARHYAFYPEFRFGGQLIDKSLEWGIFASYWDDGVGSEFQIRDGFSFSYSCATIGGKLYFYPHEIVENIFWPIYITSGISYHIVNEKYIGGTDYIGNIGKDDSWNMLTYNLGFGIYYKVYDKIRIRVEVIANIPFINQDRLNNRGRNGTVKLGVDYYFKN